MEPPPDHGEKSYQGSGRLAGRRALITGTIPGWVAPRRSYAREGADDAINYLSSEESDAQEFISLIRRAGGDTPPGDLRDESFCAKLVADTVKGLGAIDIVVTRRGNKAWRPSSTFPVKNSTGRLRPTSMRRSG